MTKRLKFMIALCILILGYKVYHWKSPQQRRIIKISNAQESPSLGQNNKLVVKKPTNVPDPSIAILGYPLDLAGVEEFVSAEEVASFIEDVIGMDEDRSKTVRCETKNNHCLLDKEMNNNSQLSYCITYKRNCLEAMTDPLFLEVAQDIMITSQKDKEKAKLQLREFILTHAPKIPKIPNEPSYVESECEVMNKHECNADLEIQETSIGSYLCWTTHQCVENL